MLCSCMEYSKTQEKPQAEDRKRTENIRDDPLSRPILGEDKSRVSKPGEHEEPGEIDCERIDGTGDEKSDAGGVEEGGQLEEVREMPVDDHDVLRWWLPIANADVLRRDETSPSTGDADESESHPEEKDEKCECEHRGEDGFVIHRGASEGLVCRRARKIEELMLLP